MAVMKLFSPTPPTVYVLSVIVLTNKDLIHLPLKYPFITLHSATDPHCIPFSVLHWFAHSRNALLPTAILYKQYAPAISETKPI